MTDLEKYDLVNRCETLEDLQAAITSLADENGIIQGRRIGFEAKRMCYFADQVVNHDYPAETLTRKFGVRQQALYLAYCRKENK